MYKCINIVLNNIYNLYSNLTYLSFGRFGIGVGILGGRTGIGDVLFIIFPILSRLFRPSIIVAMSPRLGGLP